MNFNYSDAAVLRDVSFSLQKGDFLGIIGTNGTGKSTLIKLILGLLPFSSGSIELFGKSIKDGIPRGKIGYVAQKAASFNTSFPATVEEVVISNLYTRRGLFHRFNADDRRLAREAIARVGMRGLENKLIGRLSGGQQQRVFIARAIVCEPELLLADEPTVGIDAASAVQINDLMRELNNDGITVIMTNHDTPALVEISNKLLIFCSHGNGEFVKTKELDNDALARLYAGKRGHHHA